MAAATEPSVGEPNVLRSIWGHRVLVLVVAAAFTLVGIGVYLVRPITYAAHAGALLQNPRSTIDSRGNGSKGDATRYVADQIAVMKSNDVLARASARMQALKGITPLSPGELQKAMTITADPGSSWVTVRVTADDPVTARYAADSEIYAYRVITKEHIAGQTRAALRKLDRAIAAEAKLMTKPGRTAAQQATALALIQQLHGRRNKIEVDGQLTGDGVSLFSAAANGKRSGAPLFASMLIGLVFGGLIGCGIAYAIDATRARRRARQGPAVPTPVAAPTSLGEQGTEPAVEGGRRWA